MRILPFLLTLMLLSLPLAAAQSNGYDGDECRDDSCPDSKEDRDGAGKDAPPSNQGEQRPDSDQNKTARDRAEAYCKEHPEERRCQSSEERFEQDTEDARRDARHVSFELDRENRTLTAYEVDGRLAFDAIVFTDQGEVALDVHQGVVRIRTNESVLQLQDSARGNLEYKSKTAPLLLDLPAGTLLGRHGMTERGHFLLLEYGEMTGKLASDRIVIDGDKLSVYGFAAFHLEPKESKPASTPEKQEVDEALERAEADRHLGAKVSIRKLPASFVAARDAGFTGEMAGGQSPSAPVSPSGGAERTVSDVEVTEYDDMEVQVAAPDELVGDSILEIQVSAELDAGRTVVLDLDPALLDGLSVSATSALKLRYFDLNDDGTRTEVVFGMADGGLKDVLDPTDDAGQPEYWIVQDADGIQVLVSFPHWSTHIVTLQNVAEYLTQPSVLIGIAAGLGGVMVAAATMLLPRRRHEDLY